MFFGVESHPVIIHFDGDSFYSRILEKDGTSTGITIKGITCDDYNDLYIAGERNNEAFVSRISWKNSPSSIDDEGSWKFTPTYGSNVLNLLQVESIAFSPLERLCFVLAASY